VDVVSRINTDLEGLLACTNCCGAFKSDSSVRAL
jgi:hypothetical protein